MPASHDMTMRWEDVSNEEYLNSARSGENKITLIWLWNDYLSSNVKSRKCVITSSSDWYEICVNDSFVPKYKDGKAPEDPTAEILTLGKYYANARSDDKQKAMEVVNNPSSIVQITTAYDTTSNSRLIVDGFKRSLGILDMINKDQQFRPVYVLECYGSIIRQMFFREFAHIAKKQPSQPVCSSCSSSN